MMSIAIAGFVFSVCIYCVYSVTFAVPPFDKDHAGVVTSGPLHPLLQIKYIWNPTTHYPTGLQSIIQRRDLVFD